MPKRLLVGAVLATSCTTDLRVPEGAEIACDRTVDCPNQMVCVVGDRSLCNSRDAPCIEKRGDHYAPVADGNVCTVEQGGVGTCLAGACIETRCGDGFVSGGEACEEIPGTPAFDNPNDGCHSCRGVNWIPSVLVGSYAGGEALDTVAVGGPVGMAFDGSSALYVADPRRHRVWRIDLEAQRITTFAGDGTPGRSGDGQPATLAQLNGPRDVAIDRLGNVYIADTLNFRVRKVDPFGVITTFAGGGPQCDEVEDPSCSDGTATEVFLWRPHGVAVSRSGVVYVTVPDFRGPAVYRITPDGLSQHLAGIAYRSADSSPFDAMDPLDPAYGCDDGPALTSRMRTPEGIVVVDEGDDEVVYVADATNNRVVKIEDGQLTTVVGPEPDDSATGNCLESGGFGGDGGPALGAALDRPTDIALAPDGSLYVADTYNQRLRRVTDSSIDSVAADVAGIGTTDEELNFPGFVYFAAGLALDRDGRVYVSSEILHRINRVDPAAAFAVESFAGTGVDGLVSEGSPALVTDLEPAGLAFDASGHLLIADALTERVVRLEPNGTLTTFAGTGDWHASGDGGPATAAGLMPRTMTDDGAGTIYVSDYLNRRIRRITPDGIISTVAGDGERCNWNDDLICGDGGYATAAHLGLPTSLAWRGGDLFIGTKYRIRRVDSSGIIHTVAGSTASGDAGDGGPAVDATVDVVTALGFDKDDALCLSTAFQRVRCIDGEGIIDTVAGNGLWGGTFAENNDLPADTVGLRNPHDIVAPPPTATWVPANTRLLFTEQRRYVVRSVDTGGYIHLAAGNQDESFGGDGRDATDASFRWLTRMARDDAGNLLIADERLVRKIASDGTITTLAGAVFPGDGGVTLACLGNPAAMASLPGGTSLLVADGQRGSVRLVDPSTATVETILGYPGGGFGDATAQLEARNAPTLGDAAGLVVVPTSPPRAYVADRGAHVVVELTLVEPASPSTWTVRTYAGETDSPGHLDGSLVSSRFNGPAGLAFDADEDCLYVVEATGHTVRRIDRAQGDVTTIAGTYGLGGYFGDGGPAIDALFNGPRGILVGTDHNLYVADTDNHRVRRIDPAGVVSTVIGGGYPSSVGDGAPAYAFPVRSPSGLATDEFGNLYITSSDALRLVTAANGVFATGEDAVLTLYGAPPRTSFPESTTRCLSGVLVESDSIFLLDACLGSLLRLDRS